MSDRQGCAVADAAVVVVNYRTPELVEHCLDAVPAAAAGMELEVVVVDNGSGDGSVERLRAREPAIAVEMLPENRGFAAGVNAGVAASSAPYVILLNPDAEPRPGAVAGLVEHLRRHPGIAVAAPVLLHPDGSLQLNGYRRFPNLLTVFVEFCIPLGYALVHVPWLHPHAVSPRRLRRGGRVAHAYGAALAIRRAAYDAVGGLDEGFFLYLEETEWQQRLARAGWEIHVIPDAEVVHLVRGGGEAADVASPHYLPSLYRYMALQGHTAAAVDCVLLAAAALSRVTLGLIARLFPSKREVSLRKRAGFAELTRTVRARAHATG